MEIASGPGSSAVAEKAWVGRGYGQGRGQASPVDGHTQHGAAQRPLTSAEPDSVLLKAVAALVQESLVEAWTGSAARAKTASEGVKEERQARVRVTQTQVPLPPSLPPPVTH